MRFTDRVTAGKLLVERLRHLQRDDVVVLGLPRGGVPVAAEVARGLGCPLDVILVRKLGLPWQRELAFGAIGEDGVTVLNDDIVRSSGLTSVEIERVEEHELVELERRAHEYRHLHERVPIRGKTAVIVDDGIATGATAKAACAVARGAGAAHVVVAVPVAPAGWESGFVGEADEQMSLFAPADFGSVGYFYDSFEPISDEEVMALLLSSSGAVTETDVHEVMGGVAVDAHLVVAPASRAVALFIHGSGSSRASARNLAVSRLLADAGISGVLVDVPTDGPGGDALDLSSVVSRLSDISRWISQTSRFAGLPLVLVGSSSGAALAIATAVSLRGSVPVTAVISRGGNLAAVMEVLGEVEFPVLMIVGSKDSLTREQNARACSVIGPTCRLEIVDGASHLFADAGTLETAGRLAARFIGHVIAP